MVQGIMNAERAGKDYAAKCREYIERHRVAAEQMVFPESVHTAADAIRLTGASLPVVKTVVLAVGSQGNEGQPVRFIACLLRGEHKVDLAKIRAIMGTGAVRVATREEVLIKTGYPAGGVPPFGHGLDTLMDEAVVGLDMVTAGGGSDKALVKTTAQELLRITGARIVKIAR
jgi:prolyl-tRNA editing enzyme YbaK/EbsC (Cys-tRNA(Pro) deacylase)